MIQKADDLEHAARLDVVQERVMRAKIRVDLVTATPTGGENLGVQSVAAALRDSGHRPRLIAYRGVGDLEAAARRVAEDNAPLVGMSVLSGRAAIDALAFAYRLRALGCRSHITFGGTYATLCRTRLLKEHPVIDSIVRHNGELSMVELADAVAENIEIRTVAGVSTAEGDGPPSMASLEMQHHILPERPFQKLYAGVKAAQVSAVRGCWGSCAYCGLRALRADAGNEARRCGMTPAEIRRAGVGATQRRAVDSVADEIADLYHQRDVRFFHFVDENHLPRDNREARNVIEALTAALDERGVEHRAVNLMLRADAASADVVVALRRLGLVRCLLGVESLSRPGLRALKRGADPDTCLEAMDNLKRSGIVFHFNMLLIHPDSTMDSIDGEIGALESVSGGLIDPFQVEVFEGTEVFDRLANENRLLGGPLLWHFWPKDPEARRFAELFYRLKRDVFGRVHMTAYAYEVLGSLAVAQRLGFVRRRFASLWGSAHRLIGAHNALWLDLLQELSRLARTDAPMPEQARCMASARFRAALLVLAYRDLREQVEAASSQPLQSQLMYPGAAAAVAVALAIVGASACASSFEGPGDGALASPRDAEVVGAEAGSGPDRNDSGVAPQDSGVAPTDGEVVVPKDGGSPTPDDAAMGLNPDAGGHDAGASVCDGQATMEERQEVDNLLSQADLCFDEHFYDLILVLDANGHAIDLVRDSGLKVEQPTKDAYLAALGGQTFPCLGQEGELWLGCGVLLA